MVKNAPTDSSGYYLTPGLLYKVCVRFILLYFSWRLFFKGESSDFRSILLKTGWMLSQGPMNFTISSFAGIVSETSKITKNIKKSNFLVYVSLRWLCPRPGASYRRIRCRNTRRSSLLFSVLSFCWTLSDFWRKIFSSLFSFYLKIILIII